MMKIAFFDNLANNAYRLVKVFRKHGYQTDLLLDPSDTFPMSQPMWEDCEFEVCTDLLNGSSLSPQYWTAKGRELGWQNPSWIKRIGCTSSQETALSLLTRPWRYGDLLLAAIKQKSFFPCRFEPIRRIMRNYDVIIAFGLGPIYASFSGSPYIHYPYGGDLMLIPFQRNAVGNLQRDALKKAKHIIVGDSDYFTFLRKLGIESKGIFLPFMMDAEVYKPMSKAEAYDRAEAGLRENIRGQFVFFVPSRQDFYWKGSDKVLKAFAKLANETNEVFMILSGWGADLEKSKELVGQLGLKDRTFFLPYICSAKRLRVLYCLADVVVDQFVLGAYGTSAMEAMACGRPVILDFDKKRYMKIFGEAPPFLAAHSVEEIYSTMRTLSQSASIMAQEAGEKGREWMIEYHGIKNNLDKYIELCRRCVRKG